MISYKAISGRFDVYILFYEIGLLYLRRSGILGLITPYSVLVENYGTELRKKILWSYKIESILDLTETKVFSDATVNPIVWIISNKSASNSDESAFILVKFNNKHTF